jgi:putative colanic acid biosynthesis UDP-glucose lipid carrier transferase
MDSSLPPGRSDAPRARAELAGARLTPGAVGLALRAADPALIALAAIATFGSLGRVPGSPALFWFAVACAALVALDLFAAAELYRARDLGSVRAQVIRFAAAWTAVQAFLVLLAVATRSTAELPLDFFRWWWSCALAALVLLHGAVAVAVGRGQRAGWLATRVALVGAGPQADHFIGHVRRHDPGVVVMGIFDERRSRVPDQVAGYPVLGTLDDLVAFARAERVDQIIVTLPQHAAGRRLACFERLRDLPVDVRLSPDLPGMELAGRGVAELAGMPLLSVFDRPLTGWGSLAKAVEDRVLAALVLALAAR